VAFWRFCQYCR